MPACRKAREVSVKIIYKLETIAVTRGAKSSAAERGSILRRDREATDLANDTA